MVRPAAPVAATVSKAASRATSKPNAINHLQSGFQALLLNALSSRGAGLGHAAGSAKLSANGLANACHARFAPKPARSAAGHKERADADLDPLARSLAWPGVATAPAAHAVPSGESAFFDATDARALEDTVRRIAWGGDRRRGVARLELGGNYEGTVVTVRGEGREVALTLEIPPGTDVNRLPERLVERLTARGLTVTTIEVA